MGRSRCSTVALAQLATIALFLFSSVGTDTPRGAAPPYSVIDLGTFNKGTVEYSDAMRRMLAAMLVLYRLNEARSA